MKRMQKKEKKRNPEKMRTSQYPVLKDLDYPVESASVCELLESESKTIATTTGSSIRQKEHAVIGRQQSFYERRDEHKERQKDFHQHQRQDIFRVLFCFCP